MEQKRAHRMIWGGLVLSVLAYAGCVSVAHVKMIKRGERLADLLIDILLTASIAGIGYVIVGIVSVIVDVMKGER